MTFTSVVAGFLLATSAGVVGFKPNIFGSLELLVHPGRPLMVPQPLREDTIRSDFDQVRDRDGGDKNITSWVISDVTIRQGSFNQLIDHSNPSLGTFPQRFWWSADHFAGPGSPVVLFTPGCCSGMCYMSFASNKSMPGAIAQAVGGATIVYESRYSGESFPFTELTTANLTHLTLENQLLDATNLAKNIQLPFDLTRGSTPDKAPWIFVGGNFAGALSAWTERLHPGTFWAHLASSATVEGVSDLWTYYDSAQNYGTKNCTADVNKVIDYMDSVFESGDKEKIQALKEKFGFGELAQPVDMMSALAWGPQAWQYHGFADQFYNYSSPYFEWCDYVENVWPESGNKTPGAEGVGLEKALEGYAKWSRDSLIPDLCDSYAKYWNRTEWNGTMNVQCFDTFNASSPMYTDRSSKHGGQELSALWAQCNEPFEWWKNGPPKGKPALVSRLIDTKYWQRQCALYFPAENGTEAVGVVSGKNASDINKVTGGWDFSNATRIIFSSGEYEAYLPTTVSAKERPGGPLNSTEMRPVFLTPGATENNDLRLIEGRFNGGAQATIAKELGIMIKWVQDFYKEHNIAREFAYRGLE